MFLVLLHPGDLSLWQLLLSLVVLALMLLIFVGLPLSLFAYMLYQCRAESQADGGARGKDKRQSHNH